MNLWIVLTQPCDFQTLGLPFVPFPPLSMPVTEASYRSTSAWLPGGRIQETFPGSAAVWTAVELSSDWSIDWLMYHSRCPGKTWWFWPRSVCWLTKSWSPEKTVGLGNSTLQKRGQATSDSNSECTPIQWSMNHYEDNQRIKLKSKAFGFQF